MNEKQRVQFDFSPDILEILDQLKDHTDVSTRAEAVRNAIKFHYEHLPTGPHKLVLSTQQEVPQETQQVLTFRLGHIARHLINNAPSISYTEIFNICLVFAKDILYELCHTYDPPIHPKCSELIIVQAIHAAITYAQSL